MPTRPVTVRPAVSAARMLLLAGVPAVRVLMLAIAPIAPMLVLMAAPASAVEAQGIRLDPVEPSSLGAGSVLRPALAPGGTATYDLALHNQRDESVEVLLYGADVTGDEVATGADNTGVGAWIVAAAPRVVLEPGGDAIVAVTITRPTDDSGGGTGAIVAQLSERSRQDLGLDVIRRAALRVEVAADGIGQGLHVAVTGQDPSRGLVPGVLTVEVTVTNPGDEEAAFDGALQILRRLGGDASRELAGGTLAPGEQAVRRVEVELPWYGVIGRLRAEAATVAVTASSPTARLVVVPPWIVLPLLVVAVWAVVRIRRSDQPLLLGRVPGIGDPRPVDELHDEPSAETDEDAGDEGHEGDEGDEASPA